MKLQECVKVITNWPASQSISNAKTFPWLKTCQPQPNSIIQCRPVSQRHASQIKTKHVNKYHKNVKQLQVATLLTLQFKNFSNAICIYFQGPCKECFKWAVRKVTSKQGKTQMLPTSLC